MHELLSELQALEVELHHPGTWCTGARLQELLHEEFYEIGRSGRAYDRVTVIALLSQQEGSLSVISDGFSVHELASGTALLNYRSANQQEDGSLANHTLRSSVWLQVGSQWRLRYHQGTPAAEPWHANS